MRYLNLTIPQGAQQSDVQHVGDALHTPVAILTPAALTSDSLTIESVAEGARRPLYYEGADVAVAVQPGKQVVLGLAGSLGVRTIGVKASAAEAAERTIIVVLAPVTR